MGIATLSGLPPAWRHTSGQAFLASAGSFAAAFDDFGPAPAIRLDLSQAHIWDVSAIAALGRVMAKLFRTGTRVELVGLNEERAALPGRVAATLHE